MQEGGTAYCSPHWRTTNGKIAVPQTGLLSYLLACRVGMAQRGRSEHTVRTCQSRNPLTPGCSISVCPIYTTRTAWPTHTLLTGVLRIATLRSLYGRVHGDIQMTGICIDPIQKAANCCTTTPGIGDPILLPTQLFFASMHLGFAFLFVLQRLVPNVSEKSSLPLSTPFKTP